MITHDCQSEANAIPARDAYDSAVSKITMCLGKNHPLLASEVYDLGHTFFQSSDIL